MNAETIQIHNTVTATKHKYQDETKTVDNTDGNDGVKEMLKVGKAVRLSTTTTTTTTTTTATTTTTTTTTWATPDDDDNDDDDEFWSGEPTDYVRKVKPGSSSPADVSTSST